MSAAEELIESYASISYDIKYGLKNDWG